MHVNISLTQLVDYMYFLCSPLKSLTLPLSMRNNRPATENLEGGGGRFWIKNPDKSSVFVCTVVSWFFNW